MREGATLPPSRISSRRRPIVIVLAVLSGALLAYGSFGGLGTGPSLELIGVGCLGLFVAVGLGASQAVAPLVGAVGAPMRALGGEGGELASGNAAPNTMPTGRPAPAVVVGLPPVPLGG